MSLLEEHHWLRKYRFLWVLGPSGRNAVTLKPKRREDYYTTTTVFAGDHIDLVRRHWNIFRDRFVVEVVHRDLMSFARRDDSCGADVLELYLRFRAKQDTMTKRTWIELLDVTIPKLKVIHDPSLFRRHWYMCAQGFVFWCFFFPSACTYLFCALVLLLPVYCGLYYCTVCCVTVCWVWHLQVVFVRFSRTTCAVVCLMSLSGHDFAGRMACQQIYVVTNSTGTLPLFSSSDSRSQQTKHF